MKKEGVLIFKKAATGVTIAIMAFALLLNISTLLCIHAIKNGKSIKVGYSSAIISSGSMMPSISKNDLLIIKASESYQIGDIVTYVSHGGSLVTHRIINTFAQSYLTQGDANNIPDDEIAQQRVLGKVFIIIPRVGGLLYGILSPIGIILSSSILVLVWMLRRVSKEQNESKQNQ